jgi:hypothetical protein
MAQEAALNKMVIGWMMRVGDLTKTRSATVIPLILR